MVTTRGQKQVENLTAAGRKVDEEIPDSPSNKKLPVRAKQEELSGRAKLVVEIPIVKMTPIPGTQEEVEDDMFAEEWPDTGEEPGTKVQISANAKVEDEAIEVVAVSSIPEVQEQKPEIVDLTTKEVEEADDAENPQKESKSKIEDLEVEVIADVHDVLEEKAESPIEIQDSQESDDESVVKVIKEEGTPKKETIIPVKSAKQSQVLASKAPDTMPGNPKHKRFGSKEPDLEPELFSTARQTVESEDGESSDDDMVEEITAQDASRIASAKAREAAKAIEEQEAALRQMRKDRDAALKKQAETASKKRKRENDIEERQAKKANIVETPVEDAAPGPKKARFADSEENADVEIDFEVDKPKLLKFLTEDSLSDDGPEVSNGPTSFPVDGPPKKTDITGLAKIPRKCRNKDVEGKTVDRKGKTGSIYRVVESPSIMLAPKADLTARSSKEQWMNNREGKGASMKRKAWATGFYKGKGGKPRNTKSPLRGTVQRRHKPDKSEKLAVAEC